MENEESVASQQIFAWEKHMKGWFKQIFKQQRFLPTFLQELLTCQTQRED